MKINHLILLLFAGFSTIAQNRNITLHVQDSSKNPVSFANIQLTGSSDSNTKSAIADEKGNAVFEIATTGNYVIKANALGYTDAQQNITVTEKTSSFVITLNEEISQIAEVAVTSKRPVIKRKIDRLEFDVENSTLSSENAWEILQKTPGVSIASDVISIRGSSSILVTINDKKVYLTGTELKNLLENTDGDNIKSVEVITNPPARYEAQGSAVLNIKMKKNGVQGYKATVAGAYVQSTYPKGVVSTNQYYKTNKLTLYGGYMYGSGTYLASGEERARYLNDAGEVQSDWKSNTHSVYRAKSQNTYNFTAEYQLDSLNTVAVGGNGFSSLKSTGIFTTPNFIYDGNGNLDSLYYNRARRDYPQKNNSVNGSFEHKFTDKSKLIFSSDYTWHYFNQRQDVMSQFSLPGQAPYRNSRFLSDDNRRIKLFSAQADYTAQGEGHNFETGVRYGNVNADSSLDFFNESGGVMVNNPGRSNIFLYNESVYAGYVSYDREFGKWSFKGGLRGEYTHLKGNSVTTAEVKTQDYFKLFPTFYSMYKADDNHQIGLSYGKRITRPLYAWLNPFRTYADPYTYTTGDPNLQAAISHNTNIQYTLKNKYNFDLYYNYEKNPSMEVIYQDYATTTFVTQITNIKKNINYGIDFNSNLELLPWWTSGIYLSGRFSNNTFQGVDGNLYNNDNWNYSVNSNNRFTLTKKKDLTAEANFFYQSATAQATYEVAALSGLSLSIRKTFFDGNGEITLILSDIYRGQEQKITTRYANQSLYSSNYNDNRSFRIQFRYRLGNQKLEGAKTRQQTQEQQRL